jgi:hypothetical protein
VQIVDSFARQFDSGVGQKELSAAVGHRSVVQKQRCSVVQVFSRENYGAVWKMGMIVEVFNIRKEVFFMSDVFIAPQASQKT